MSKKFDMVIRCEPEGNDFRLSIVLTNIYSSGEIPEDMKNSMQTVTDPEKRNKHFRSIIRLLENSIQE